MSPTVTIDTDSEPGSWERAINRGCGPRVPYKHCAAPLCSCTDAQWARCQDENNFTHGEAYTK